MGRYKQTPENVAAHIERRTEALKLKRAGKTYQYIYEASILWPLGYANKSAAWKDVQQGLEDLRTTEAEEADKLRVLELARLEELWAAAYPLAVAGNLRAIETCVKVSDRRARLMGLDAPVRAEVTVSTNTSARIEELLALMSGQKTPVIDVPSYETAELVEGAGEAEPD